MFSSKFPDHKRILIRDFEIVKKILTKKDVPQENIQLLEVVLNTKTIVEASLVLGTNRGTVTKDLHQIYLKFYCKLPDKTFRLKDFLECLVEQVHNCDYIVKQHYCSNKDVGQETQIILAKHSTKKALEYFCENLSEELDFFPEEEAKKVLGILCRAYTKSIKAD